MRISLFSCFFFLFSFVLQKGRRHLDKKNVDVAFVETTLLKQQQKQETRTTTVRSPTVYVKTIAQRYYQPTYV